MENKDAMFHLVTAREESSSGMHQMKGYGLEELLGLSRNPPSPSRNPPNSQPQTSEVS